MRSILEIIIAAQECQPATDEELRLALAATSAMLSLAERANRKLVDAVIQGDGSVKFFAECFKRENEVRFASRKLAPDKYLGPTFTPGTPENIKHRDLAKKIFEKATGEKL